MAEGFDSCEEPYTYEEEVSFKDSSRWMVVMPEGMESFHKNGTWDLVKLPKEKKAVRCKWVFKRKEGIPGVEEVIYKVRLVSKGYNQIQGVDFIDVSSAALKHSYI